MKTDIHDRFWYQNWDHCYDMTWTCSSELLKLVGEASESLEMWASSRILQTKFDRTWQDATMEMNTTNYSESKSTTMLRDRKGCSRGWKAGQKRGWFSFFTQSPEIESKRHIKKLIIQGTLSTGMQQARVLLVVILALTGER